MAYAMKVPATSADDRIVAIYVRVSTGYQVDKDSLPFQKKELKAYCKHILHVDMSRVEIFEDAGRSGKNTKRPAYERMMQKVRAGLVSHVLVYKIDRISRNLVDFSLMYDDFKYNRVTFVSLNEQFDTSSAIGEAVLKIILVFAELERKLTSERVKDIMIGRANEGKWNGARVPYGWDWDSSAGWPVHSEKEAPFGRAIRFIEAAGNFVYDPSDSQSYVDLLTASSNVILFCTDKTHKLLSDFITYTENFTECRILPDDELKNYHQNLSKLSLAFREELENLRFSD